MEKIVKNTSGGVPNSTTLLRDQFVMNFTDPDLSWALKDEKSNLKISDIVKM